MKKIAILGPGAVAGVIAWRLAHAGFAPTIVARPATAAAIAREGLTLIERGGSQAIRATSDPQALGPQDAVIVGFKAHDWAAGRGAALPLIGADTVIVPMLNGVPWWFFQGFGGAHEGRIVEAVDPGGELAASIPAGAVVGGVSYLAAERESPTRILWNGRNRLVIGEPRGGVSARVETLASILREAGFATEASADIRGALWHKLLGNATYNPLSVVTGATMDRMGSHPPLRRIVRAMMEEAASVARALGVGPVFDLDARLAMPPEMKGVKPSTLQDFEAGRPLELAALVDAVVELGRLAGVEATMIETIGALARERTAGRDAAPAGERRSPF